MSFEILATKNFEKRLKNLKKKYNSFPSDLAEILDQLEEKPDLGTPIGKNCYKIRVPIASKGKGKRAGARLITYVRIIKSRVYLVDIYDKSEQIDISQRELEILIKMLEGA